MFTQPKQDINIWDLELCILHPGTQRVWGAKFELDITELNSKLRHMQKGSSYRLRLLTCGGRLFPQLADIRRKLFTHLYQLFFTMQILLSHSARKISMDIELNATLRERNITLDWKIIVFCTSVNMWDCVLHYHASVNIAQLPTLTTHAL